MSSAFENAIEARPPRYAEVAVPVHVARTFIYRLKEWMRNDAQVGSRILVPLGRSAVTGYIVGLHETLNADENLNEADLKDAENILDVTPICTPEVLEITRWVSDYYGSQRKLATN